MGAFRIVILMISLFFAHVYSQDVTVTFTINNEMPRAGDELLMTCIVSGIGLDLSTDNVFIRKLNNDGSSVILADNNDNTNLPENWLLTSFSPIPGGGSMSLYSFALKSSDKGDYSCTVLRDSNTLGQDTIHLDILYVPSLPLYCAPPDPFPQSSGTYYDGEVVTFSCSSDLGNPTVNLAWSRNDGSILPQPVVTETNGLISKITVTLSISDSDVIFTCTSTSDEFPDYEETCIPTSLTVVPRPSTITTPSVTTPSPSTTQQPIKTATTMRTLTSVVSNIFKETTTSQQLSTADELETSTTSAPSSSFLGDDNLKIWVIAGGSGGILLIVVAIISLCCLIRSYNCCSRNPKLILPTTNSPSSYYNDIKIPDLEMRQSNNGDEGIVPHVSSADGTLYARVNKDRKSVNSRHFRKEDEHSTYPDSEFDVSSQGGYYTNGNDELEPEPPKRTTSERLYEMTPSDSDNEEHIQEDQYGNVTNIKPSYYDDLDPKYGNLE